MRSVSVWIQFTLSPGEPHSRRLMSKRPSFILSGVNCNFMSLPIQEENKFWQNLSKTIDILRICRQVYHVSSKLICQMCDSTKQVGYLLPWIIYGLCHKVLYALIPLVSSMSNWDAKVQYWYGHQQKHGVDHSSSFRIVSTHLWNTVVIDLSQEWYSD